MMKKVLSLVLVVCMAFSCLALSACVWEGIWQTTTSTIPTVSTTQPTTKPTTSTSTTTTTTTTTIPDDGGEPEDLVIQHGDNFTEEDINFLEWLHGNDSPYASTDKRTGNLALFIIEILVKNDLLYASTDIDSGYYICAYRDLDALSPDEIHLIKFKAIDVTQYKWYKFDITDEIPKQIDDLELYDELSHMLFDSKVSTCISESKFENVNTKYILLCRVSQLQAGLEHMKEYQNMLRINYGEISSDNDFNMIYLESTDAPWFQLQCHIDNNGKKYIVHKGYMSGTVYDGVPTYNEDLLNVFLKVYREDLVSYLTYLPELNEVMSDGSTRCYFGLPLDDFLDYVNGLMK